jgi:hypothetical protein
VPSCAAPEAASAVFELSSQRRHEFRAFVSGKVRQGASIRYSNGRGEGASTAKGKNAAEPVHARMVISTVRRATNILQAIRRLPGRRAQKRPERKCPPRRGKR